MHANNISTICASASIEKIALAIYFNRDITPALDMNELKAVKDFISQFPDSIEVILGIFCDDNMDNQTVKVSALISGKNLKL